MHTMQVKLLEFIDDSIHPATFSGRSLAPQEFKKWRVFITNVTKALKSYLLIWLNGPQASEDQHLVAFVNQLVVLSNVINGYLFKHYRLYKAHPQAMEIRRHYHYSLKAVEDLITYSAELNPKQVSRAIISNARLPEVISGLKEKLNRLALLLRKNGIPAEPSDIVIKGILQLIKKKNIRQSNTVYINSLLNIMLGESIFDVPRLVDLLIVHDFNLPEFFLFCVNSWRNKLSAISGLHEQWEMLLLERDRLYSLVLEKGLRMPEMHSTLFMDLNEFLVEKSALLKQLIRIRKKVTRDAADLKSMPRFLINLSVPQFGLFIRMQIEKGLLVKENLGELFNFFSTYFYTPNTTFISADNLLKKSTDVDFSTAQKMKTHLIGMLNWLNTNYNLSNYN